MSSSDGEKTRIGGLPFGALLALQAGVQRTLSHRRLKGALSVIVSQPGPRHLSSLATPILLGFPLHRWRISTDQTTQSGHHSALMALHDVGVGGHDRVRRRNVYHCEAARL
jgi:hypothetical protein